MSSLLKWEKGGLKSTAARARGLGSAKEGVGHWMGQRITAISNLFLMIWFMWSILNGAASDYHTLTMWLKEPVNAILSILFITSTFYHGFLGVQVVIEDYIHNEGFKILKLIGTKLFFVAGYIACLFSILKISFGI